MAVGQVSKASPQCPAGIAGAENKRMGLGRQERFEKTESHEIKLLDRLRFESLFQPAHSFLVSENLTAFRLGAQSRRQVWQVTHRTVIHSAFKAHSSKGRIAGGDADTQVQIVALFSPRRASLLHSITHFN